MIINMAEYRHGGDLLAKAVKAAYEDGETDYSMKPFVRLDDSGAPIGKIKDGDAVIFCCRRGEREIELTDAFTAREFPHFDRVPPVDLEFVILTMYHEKYADMPIAFAPASIAGTVAEAVSRAGLRQLHCAESEKFAHVTYFFNGGNSKPFPGEDDVCIPSPKGIPFEKAPALSLPQVADSVISGIGAGYDFIVANFANGDVIGHTTDTDAKIECARQVDFHLGRVLESAGTAGYVAVITADHGNLEELTTPEGGPHVSHTGNPVDLLIVDPEAGSPYQVKNGALCDVGPTVLGFLRIEPTEAMTGRSLAQPFDRRDNGSAPDRRDNGSAPNRGDDGSAPNRRVLLLILDGWGAGPRENDDPIRIAETPVWDNLVKEFPPAIILTSGEAVGLQAGKPGNSEAGHINIGAGRVVKQDDVRLDEAMNDGSFENNEVLLGTIKLVRERKTRLHLLFLLTKKSSHGSIDYPLAILKMARDLPEIYLHAIFDGRSTPPGSAPDLLKELDKLLQETGADCQIVDGIGRGIALDRDGNYAKIQKAYDALVYGAGAQY